MAVVQVAGLFLVILILVVASWTFWRGRRRQRAPFRIPDPVVTDASRYKPGQVWSLKSPDSPQALLKILRVESLKGAGTIVHVAVTNIPVTVGHMPFAEAAIDQSVLQLVGTDAVPPESLEGYHEWRNAFDKEGAGWFTIPVPEALKILG
jgi:hypothetical protein